MISVEIHFTENQPNIMYIAIHNQIHSTENEKKIILYRQNLFILHKRKLIPDATHIYTINIMYVYLSDIFGQTKFMIFGQRPQYHIDNGSGTSIADQKEKN